MNFLDLSIEGYDESTQIPACSLDEFWNTEKLSNSNIVYVEFKKTKSKYYDDILTKLKHYLIIRKIMDLILLL